MRYNLGYMDKYPIEAAGTCVENNPMIRVVFKRPIDPIKLEDACHKALDSYPLFKTSVEFDHEYYLRTNDLPLVILDCKEEERPNTFGKNTNKYPWRICYHLNTLCFEWLHGVSDGAGAIAFLNEVLLAYFDFELKSKSTNFLVAPGLEPFFDSKEKGENFKVDPPGFSFKNFPYIKRGYKTDCYCLHTDTKNILEVSKYCHSSVTPIIAILFSQAIRMHLPKKIKNRNVSCNIVLNLRKCLKYETMHNCVEYKRITYIDQYDDMNLASIAKIYKDILDNSRIEKNIVRAVTERVRLFKAYHMVGRKWFLKPVVKLIGKALKHVDCNFVVTYPGKINLPAEVIDKIENIDLKIWHDFGECIISALDFNGRFNLNIHENFVEKGIVEDFIKLSREVGIVWEETERSVFEQSHFEE